jgi:hypothetical protein
MVNRKLFEEATEVIYTPEKKPAPNPWRRHLKMMHGSLFGAINDQNEGEMIRLKRVNIELN